MRHFLKSLRQHFAVVRQKTDTQRQHAYKKDKERSEKENDLVDGKRHRSSPETTVTIFRHYNLPPSGSPPKIPNSY